MKYSIRKIMYHPCILGVCFLAPMPAAFAETHNPNAHIALSLQGLSSTSTPVNSATHTLSNALDIPDSAPLIEGRSISEFGPWLTNNGVSVNAQQLIRAIQNAASHGLNPEAYGLSKLLNTVDTLNMIDRAPSGDGVKITAELSKDREILRSTLSTDLNTAFVKLAEHLGHGTVNAKATQRRLFRDVPEFNAKQILATLHSGTVTVSDALEVLTPQHPDYQRLTAKMRDLLTEQSTGVERTAVNPSSDLTDSQVVGDLLAIQQRLIETGELPPNIEFRTQWNQTLQIATLEFQNRHGIEETGIADERTRAALNITNEQEIEAIALSLERWRWMPRDLGETHIFVNIPEFRVAVRKNQETLLVMNTVVGATEHPTAAFSEDMSYIEFNPTWTVPASIANKELIPLELRKPGYLASRNFDFLQLQKKGLVKVPASQITQADLEKDVFPYTLQQRGGSNNALGNMKFMMPNPYSIYLHDTQSKNDFALNSRAFSHGCIRLSDPESLARLLLELDGHTEEFTNSVLLEKKTKKVRLREVIPTHLTYMTTWIDNSGVLHQRPDIYKHDASLLTALRDSNTLLTTIQARKTSFALSDS